MLSKESILKQFIEGFNGYEIGRVVLAMDKYAMQKSIGFAEWLKETNWNEKETWGKHDPPSIPTTKELYQQYLKSKPR